jgi:hypothetical protein
LLLAVRASKSWASGVIIGLNEVRGFFRFGASFVSGMNRAELFDFRSPHGAAGASIDPAAGTRLRFVTLFSI